MCFTFICQRFWSICLDSLGCTAVSEHQPPKMSNHSLVSFKVMINCLDCPFPCIKVVHLLADLQTLTRLWPISTTNNQEPFGTRTTSLPWQEPIASHSGGRLLLLLSPQLFPCFPKVNVRARDSTNKYISGLASQSCCSSDSFL